MFLSYAFSSAFKKYANKDINYNESCLLFDKLICLPSGLNLNLDQISAVYEVIEDSTK